MRFDNELAEYERELKHLFKELDESASRLQNPSIVEALGLQNCELMYAMDCARIYNTVDDLFELFSNGHFNDYVQELFTVKGISKMVKSKEIANKFPVLTECLLRYIKDLRGLDKIFPDIVFRNGEFYFEEYMILNAYDFYFNFTEELRKSNIVFNFEVHVEMKDYERALYDYGVQFYVDGSNRVHVTLPLCVQHLSETGILSTFVMVDRLRLKSSFLIKGKVNLQFPNMLDWSYLADDVVKQHGALYENCQFRLNGDTLEKVVEGEVVEKQTTNGYLYNLVGMVLGYAPELYNNKEFRTNFEKRVLHLRYDI